MDAITSHSNNKWILSVYTISICASKRMQKVGKGQGGDFQQQKKIEKLIVLKLFVCMYDNLDGVFWNRERYYNV